MHRKMKLAGFVGAAAIGVSAIASSAAAGVNVMPNGDFSDSITGWQTTPYTKLSADGGSGVIGNTFDELSEDSIASAYQCVPISDAKNYHFFGAVYIPSGQQRSGYARLVTTFYPTNNCIGVPLDVHKSAPFHETGKWLTDSGDLLRTDPKTAYSLKVELIVKKNSTEQAALQSKSFVAKFDNIKLLQTSKPVEEPELPTAGSEDPPKPGAKQPTIVPPAPKDNGSPTPTPPSDGASEDDKPVGAQPDADDGDAASPEAPVAPQPGEPGLADGNSDSPNSPTGEATGEAPSSADEQPGGDEPGAHDEPGVTPGHEADPAPAAPATGNSGPLSGASPETDGANAEHRSKESSDSNAVFALAAAGGAGLLGIVLVATRRRRRQQG